MIYMTVSSGVAMELHYCMGKPAGVDYFAVQEKKACGKCGMTEKKGGCCTDEHKFYKLDNSHNNVYNDISFTTGDVHLVPVAPAYEWQHSNPLLIRNAGDTDPPDIPGPPGFIRNCVFRI